MQQAGGAFERLLALWGQGKYLVLAAAVTWACSCHDSSIHAMMSVDHLCPRRPSSHCVVQTCLRSQTRAGSSEAPVADLHQQQHGDKQCFSLACGKPSLVILRSVPVHRYIYQLLRGTDC